MTSPIYTLPDGTVRDLRTVTGIDWHGSHSGHACIVLDLSNGRQHVSPCSADEVPRIIEEIEDLWRAVTQAAWRDVVAPEPLYSTRTRLAELLGAKSNSSPDLLAAAERMAKQSKPDHAWCTLQVGPCPAGEWRFWHGDKLLNDTPLVFDEGTTPAQAARTVTLLLRGHGLRVDSCEGGTLVVQTEGKCLAIDAPPGARLSNGRPRPAPDALVFHSARLSLIKINSSSELVVELEIDTHYGEVKAPVYLSRDFVERMLDMFPFPRIDTHVQEGDPLWPLLVKLGMSDDSTPASVIANACESLGEGSITTTSFGRWHEQLDRIGAPHKDNNGRALRFQERLAALVEAAKSTAVCFDDAFRQRTIMEPCSVLREFAEQLTQQDDPRGLALVRLLDAFERMSSKRCTPTEAKL